MVPSAVSAVFDPENSWKHLGDASGDILPIRDRVRLQRPQDQSSSNLAISGETSDTMTRVETRPPVTRLRERFHRAEKSSEHKTLARVVLVNNPGKDHETCNKTALAAGFAFPAHLTCAKRHGSAGEAPAAVGPAAGHHDRLSTNGTTTGRRPFGAPLAASRCT